MHRLLALAACLLFAMGPRAAAASSPLPSPALSGFHLVLDLDVGPPVDVRHRATPDNPAEPGGDPSAEALRDTLQRLGVRRNMLTVHQVMAWTALSSIFAAQVVGIVNRASLQSGTPRRSTLEPSLGAHRALAATAITAYYGAGLMAWASPGPGGTRKVGDKGISQWKNTRDAHIALSIGHNIAMAMTIVTGALQANAVASKNWQGLVTAHTLSAFTTVGLMIPAAVVISRF